MILIKAQRDALLKPLQTVTGIVERRHTLPILSNVLISKTQQTISFCSTDIEMQIRTSSEMATGDDPLSTTVAARKLLDILRACQISLKLPFLTPIKNYHLLKERLNLVYRHYPPKTSNSCISRPISSQHYSPTANTQTTVASCSLRNGTARHSVLSKRAVIGD